MATTLDLTQHEIFVSDFCHNASPAQLYEEAIRQGHAALTTSGALACDSGTRTGPSPQDKRIVDESLIDDEVWWGGSNAKLDPVSHSLNRQHAISFLNTLARLYVTDGYAGWDPQYRIKVRAICETAAHALFMHNILVRPSTAELEEFGDPDFVIYDAGRMPANPFIPGLTSTTSVALSFENREIVILGTQCAGEMKHGIFTAMHYLMPKRGVLSMCCAASEGVQGDVTLFFGLPGSGRTTLSTDPQRRLIGADEHCWTDHGIFNVEAGCYTEVAKLTAASEQEVARTLKFGTVLENVVLDEQRQAQLDDASLTPDTRACFPIEFIANAKTPCTGGHPAHVILLTCDAFGVLPPVAQLTSEQALYHFISGYSSKLDVPDTDDTEPAATFSACFGEEFLVWHPAKYAELLIQRMQEHGTKVWLINTGWTGGSLGVGERISLEHTREIIDAIHDGSIEKKDWGRDPVFGLKVPKKCGRVPTSMLMPENAWSDKHAYRSAAEKLAGLFQENFAKYASATSQSVRDAGPIIKVRRKKAQPRRSIAG